MSAPIGRTRLAAETATLKVGDRAPELTLRSHDGREISLAGLRGRKVVLAFFHFAFTNT
jgi:peroxiredoxin